MRCFTLEEIRRILKFGEEPHKTLYWLAAETGLRSGELCALRVQDIDLDGELLRVERSVWRGKMQSPKSANSIRTIVLSPILAAHLRGHIRDHVKGDLLFTSRKGTPLNPENILKHHLHPLRDTLGIARGGFHTFRLANASQIASHGYFATGRTTTPGSRGYHHYACRVYPRQVRRGTPFGQGVGRSARPTPASARS